MTRPSRRSFLRQTGGVASLYAARPLLATTGLMDSPFKIAVINDEISDDFDHACFVASHDFGMRWIELRSMWGKNVTELNAAEIQQAQKILAKYALQVTDIASPLFKTDWPGAPRSPYGSTGDMHKAPEASFAHQDEILERSIELAGQFKTGLIRCFDFWRLQEVTPYRSAIDEKLRTAAESCGKHGILLVIENEPSCNTATGQEAARIMNAIQSPHFALNWDAANAVMSGGIDNFKPGWQALPKDRIRHCHCKNLAKTAAGKMDWAPIDKGVLDWTEQFRALLKSGYHGAVSLETHWSGAATPEEATRICWAGMKRDLENASVL